MVRSIAITSWSQRELVRSALLALPSSGFPGGLPRLSAEIVFPGIVGIPPRETPRVVQRTTITASMGIVYS